MDNDLIEATCYTNLICNFLYNTNRIDVDSKESLRVALTELITNAIEHGNCGITYDEKTALLENGESIGDLIKQKRCNAPYAQRRVTFEYVLESTCARFIINDQEDGFDWSAIQDASKPENVLKLHGRGILMARRYTQNLNYNDKGNSVSFELTYSTEVAHFTPALFSSIAPVEFKVGDYIFRQGEMSNFLYYIVKGEFDVWVNDVKVSYLGADDIFMGEMSFLLDNRRSATVRARTPGRLIKLSKKEFVNAIRTKPHYALFLARLLAKRIQRPISKPRNKTRFLAGLHQVSDRSRVPLYFFRMDSSARLAASFGYWCGSFDSISESTSMAPGECSSCRAVGTNCRMRMLLS